MTSKRNEETGSARKDLKKRTARTAQELRDDELDRVTGGGQSTGAGAGKVTFNPFSITRKIDKSTPEF